MTRHAAVLRHQAAGNLEPVRLFVRLRESGPGGPARDARLVEGWLRPGAQELGPLRLHLACDVDGDVATWELSLSNQSKHPVHLDAVGIGLRWRPPRLRDPRFLRQGWQSWSFAGGRALDAVGEPPFPSGAWLRGFHHALPSPPPDRAGWHESDLVSVVGATPRGPACCAGVLERGGALGVVFLRREADAVGVEVEQWVERALAPGEAYEGEAVRAALGEDPTRLLEEHAESHGRRAGARTAAPFRAAWCSWYQFFDGVDEEKLRRNLDALAAAREDLPVQVVQLDDGWQRAVGDWLETNPKFPRGLAPIAAEIREAGFEPGLWLAPFCVVPESRTHGEHSEWLLRGEDGPLRGLHHGAWTAEGWVHVLDASREDVRGHLMRLAAALVGLGFRYLKLDFLYAAALEARAHDPRLGRATRLRQGLQAIRDGAGGEAFLLGCGCPLGAAVGVVDAMRVGPDTAPWWDVREGARIPGLEPTLPAARNALRNALARSWMHRRLWLNDPDCLLVRDTDTELEAKEVHAFATAVAATGGLSVLSDDLPALHGARRKLAREALELARAVDGAGARGTSRSLDLLGDEIPSRVVATVPGGALVALFNPTDEPEQRELDLATRGFRGAQTDPERLLGSPAPGLWKEGRLGVELAPHAAALFRVRAAPRLAVFCDFDGTFAVQDVGSTLARRYAAERREALWERLSRGELTAWGYNLELLDGLHLPRAELEAFLRTVELDPGARDLVAWCQREGIPFRVLSDGFDRNLERLQELNGLPFAYDANHLHYEGERWRIEAVYPNASCTCGTGTCKRGRIEAFRRESPGVVVVHIGNGRVSDLCGADAADVVFAKDTLAEALEERGVHFERFRTLHDVRAGLERLIARLSAPA